MIIQTSIKDRTQLLEHVCQFGFGSLSVEVGVLFGGFSCEILNTLTGILIGIDPYEPFWEAPMDRTEHYDAMMRNTERQRDEGRFFLYREKDSYGLADRVVREHGDPDFVYIDGDHKYEPCKMDIEIWSRILIDHKNKYGRGGIIAGHDYTDRLPGVVRAVHEVANERPVYLTGESDWKSWFFVV